jgi:hypothetical protein
VRRGYGVDGAAQWYLQMDDVLGWLGFELRAADSAEDRRAMLTLHTILGWCKNMGVGTTSANEGSQILFCTWCCCDLDTAVRTGTWLRFAACCSGDILLDDSTAELDVVRLGLAGLRQQRLQEETA